MNTRRDDEAGDGAFIKDDVFDDAMAAYRELAAGGDASSSTPGASEQPPASARQKQQDDGDDDAAGQDEQPPENETAEQRTARENRDNKGRFAKRTPDATGKPQDGRGDPASQRKADDGSTPAGQQGDAPATVSGPPPSWGVKAKAAWDQLPETVRAEISKREGEVQQGLRALQDYKGLEPYAQQLRQMGGSVKQAMDHYVAIDRLMNQDLAGGIAVAAESYQKDRAKLGQMFADLAKRYGATVTPQPGSDFPTLSEDDPLAAALKPFLQPLISQINDMKTQHSSRAEADRNAQVQSLAGAIQSFATDPKNVYFANVEQDIARLFASGMVPNSGNPAKDLQTAYDMACRLHPEVSAALIEKQTADRLAAERQREQAKAEKARQTSRSLGGSRMPGLTYQQQPQHANGHDDVEADVRAAFRAHAS